MQINVETSGKQSTRLVAPKPYSSRKCSQASKLNQPRTFRTKVNRSTVRRLRSQAEQVVKQHKKRGVKNKDNSRKPTGITTNTLAISGEYSDYSDFTDTSGSVFSDQEKDNQSVTTNSPTSQLCEDELLHVIASQMSFATPKQLGIKGDLSEKSESESSSAVNDMTEVEVSSHINQDSEEGESSVPQTAMDMEATETNESENPEVMSLPTVAAMFSKLRNEMKKGMDDLNAEIIKLQQQKNPAFDEGTLENCKTEIVKAVDITLEADRKEVTKLREDVKHFKFRNRALTGVVDRMAIEIEDLKQRLEAVELNNYKHAITITGLFMPEQKNEGCRAIEQFINECVGVAVNVDDYFQTGANSPKLIVAFLQNSQQKRDVLHFKGYLKGCTNEMDQPYFINDYVPAATQERRKREGDVFRINSKLEAPKEVKFVKGKLTIQGQVYQQRISPPTPAQIVDLSPQELDEILKMELEHGGTVTEQQSVFDGYTACVSTFAEIRKLYTKIRLIQPSARHVVCGYFIKGDKFYSQDFADDGEPAAGRAVLDILTRNNMQNRVVFVTRKFGGIKMGPNRFECYRQAAKAALKSLSWNKKLNIHQHLLTPDDQAEHAKNANRAFRPKVSTNRNPKRPASSPATSSRGRSFTTKRPFRRGYGYKYPSVLRGANQAKPSHQAELNSIRGAFQSTQSERHKSSWNYDQSKVGWADSEFPELSSNQDWSADKEMNAQESVD